MSTPAIWRRGHRRQGSCPEDRLRRRVGSAAKLCLERIRWFWDHFQGVGLQRSTPQKLRSAEINSTPISHPSGRRAPFQTTIPFAICLVARLVMRNFSRIWISLGLASRQPYGLTTRVKPDSKWSGPALPFHSMVTGTREFMRGPRRLLLIRMSCGRSSRNAILIGSPRSRETQIERSPRSGRLPGAKLILNTRKSCGQWYEKTGGFAVRGTNTPVVAQTLLSVRFFTAKLASIGKMGGCAVFHWQRVRWAARWTTLYPVVAQTLLSVRFSTRRQRLSNLLKELLP